jgi:hypothetical protein
MRRGSWEGWHSQVLGVAVMAGAVMVAEMGKELLEVAV